MFQATPPIVTETANQTFQYQAGIFLVVGFLSVLIISIPFAIYAWKNR